MAIDEAYNQWAKTYDTAPNKTRDLEKRVAQETLARYNGAQILELGCGTGKNTEWLLKHAKAMVALDFSREMVAHARRKIPASNIEFNHADLTAAWPVANDRFDLISCSLVLEHIEDLPFIFQQASHKLVTGGHFYLCEYHPFKQYLGKKARYQDGDKEIELKVFVHNLTDYTNAALTAGLEIAEIREWWDVPGEGIPRLLSLVVRKP